MDSIVKYFEGERLQCLIGIGLSVLSLGLAIYFFYTQKPVLKGIAYPFGILAIGLIMICAGVVFRTQKDIQRVSTFYQTEPQKLQTEELPRMEKVLSNFAIIKKIELAVLAIGMVLMLIFWKNEFVRGIGIGLLVQGLILFTFDHFAEKRGKPYVEFLKQIKL